MCCVRALIQWCISLQSRPLKHVGGCILCIAKGIFLKTLTRLFFFSCNRKHRAILLGLILVLVGGALLTIGLVLYFKYPARKGAVVSNGYECASIGR